MRKILLLPVILSILFTSTGNAWWFWTATTTQTTTISSNRWWTSSNRKFNGCKVWRISFVPTESSQISAIYPRIDSRSLLVRARRSISRVGLVTDVFHTSSISAPLSTKPSRESDLARR